MYVIVAIIALLIVGLSCLASVVMRARAARRSERRRDEVAARLEAVALQAAEEYQARTAAASASSALTAVMPAIPKGEQAPRRVA